MSVSFYANGAPNDVTVGYCGLATIRRQVAKCYSAELSQIYEKVYEPHFNGYSKDDLEQLHQICPEGLDLFLFFSDSGDCLTASQCKKVVRSLDGCLMRWPQDFRDDWKVKYEDLRELMRWCADTRHSLYIS